VNFEVVMFIAKLRRKEHFVEILRKTHFI